MQSPEYRAYYHARNRCLNPNDQNWKDYGGRGIKFFFRSFKEFLKEIGSKPRPDLELDRKDNDGHYEKGNVRWATRSEQNYNKRQDTKAQEKCRSKAGKIGGRRRIDLHGNPGTFKARSELGLSGIGNHVRHHVRRGVLNPSCKLCRGLK